MKRNKFLFLLPLSLLLGACNSNINPSISGGDIDPFDFEGNYVNPELTIDGIKNEDVWNSEYACVAANFGYTLKSIKYNVEISLYRGERELCAFFEVTDCNILTDGLDKCWNNPVFNHKGHFLQYAYMFEYYM